jgi:hypothetical protein
MSFALPAVSAAGYYGPSFTTPTAIAPGGVINIGLSTIDASYFVSPPSGSGAACTSGVCSYPLEACPDTGSFYFSIHEISVTDPNGNQYMLGSAHTSGLFWPAALGGPAETGPGSYPSSPSTAPYPPADALNITVGDSFTLPFGAGLGGFTFASSLGNPPNDVSPAGPYYWWTVEGNTYGANLRLDQNPSINPTLTHGSYVVDIEGESVCGTSSVVFSDSPINAQIIFSDSPITVTTPQFGGSIVIVAGAAFVLLMLARQGAFGKKLRVFPTTQ